MKIKYKNGNICVTNKRKITSDMIKILKQIALKGYCEFKSDEYDDFSLAIVKLSKLHLIMNDEYAWHYTLVPNIVDGVTIDDIKDLVEQIDKE